MIEKAKEVVNFLPLGIVLFMLAWVKGIGDKINTCSKKEYADKHFQNKEVAINQYKELKEDLSEIKADVKSLLMK